MDGLNLNEVKRKDGWSSHSNFSSSIRPFVWLGALVGVLPYTTQRLPDDGAEGGNRRVTYKFSPLSFPFFVSVVWVLTTILYYVTVPFEVPFEGEDSYTFLTTLNKFAAGIYVCSYLPLWLVVWRASRITRLLATVDELDVALPSGGLGTCLAVGMAIGVLMLSIVIEFVFEVYVQGNDHIVPRSLVTVHVYWAGLIHFLLMSMLAAHLAQKFEVLNMQVEEAMRWKDTAKLAHLMHLHQRLRSVVREADAAFSPLIAPNYIRMMMMICMQLMLLDTYGRMGYSDLYLWMLSVIDLLSMFVFVICHTLPDLCTGKAASTVHLLEAHNHEDDAFSRQVSRWRAELASARVCFTVSGLLELTMPELWTNTQFIITIYVVLVQFTRESAVTTSAPPPISPPQQLSPHQEIF